MPAEKQLSWHVLTNAHAEDSLQLSARLSPEEQLCPLPAIHAVGVSVHGEQGDSGGDGGGAGGSAGGGIGGGERQQLSPG